MSKSSKRRRNSVRFPSAVRHGKLPRSHALLNVSRVFLTTVLVLGLSGAATLAYATLTLATDVKTVDIGAGEQDKEVAVASGSIDGPLTILLVGSDSRKGQSYDDGEEGELNDVTLLLHISADHKNATVVSLPRDLMIPIPSCPGPDGQEHYYQAMSEQQLNSSLGYGGLACVKETVEELTGMDIPYAGLITFDGVIGISNALGGVEVCLNKPISDEHTELELSVGVHTLVGYEALQFLRTRHGVGDGGDTSRINNQQLFMASLVRKLKSAGTLSNPMQVFLLAKAAVDNITLSKNMATVKFMQAVAGTVKNIELDNINFLQYPSFSHPYQRGRLRPNYQAADKMFDLIRSGKSFKVTSVGKGVSVVGDSAVQGADAGADAGAAAGADVAGQQGDATGAAGDEATILPPEVTGVQPTRDICSEGRTDY